MIFLWLDKKENIKKLWIVLWKVLISNKERNNLEKKLKEWNNIKDDLYQTKKLTNKPNSCNKEISLYNSI